MEQEHTHPDRDGAAPSEEGDPPESAVTVYDFQPDVEAKVDVRRLPRLILEGLKIVWAAGKNDLIVSTLLQAAGGVGVAALLILGQRALGALIEANETGGSIRSVLPAAGAVAIVATIQFFASAVQRERQQVLGELVSRHVEEQVLDVVSEVELESFETPTFHNRVQRIRMRGSQPFNLVYGVSSFASAIVGVLAVVIALISIEPLLIPLILVVLLPTWLVASRRGEAFWRLFWRMTPRDRERGYLATLLSDRDSAKEVRGFGLAGYLRERHRRLYDERIAELRAVARKQLIFSLIANVGTGVTLGITLLLVAWLTLQGGIPLESAGIAVAGVAVVGGRLASAGWAAGSLSEAALYIDDYGAFVELLPLAKAARPTDPAPSSFRRIDVEAVSFTYPSASEPALLDVSLHIDAGEIVALVGENGSGKTTLAKLLARLYSPTSGRIWWDGTDISSVDPDMLRRSIAVIFQDFLHYHLPARDNIGLGRTEAIDDVDAIRDAARHADADGFLSALAQGYDSMLGPEFEGGVDLSIGQWQRVALARAFFRNAPFVILDEPTSALDPRAEHELFARIRTLLADRTVLLISHRFSSVRSADRIYVMDAGRIVEAGTHDLLMQNDGLYAELFTLQAAAYLGGREEVPD
ncbi:MAG TPA: ABC transporter ATP-binding protein [Actinomycetota bacterium]|nr:ABC transporter ATP-binding protein [Actinomycetota bacterium]